MRPEDDSPVRSAMLAGPMQIIRLVLVDRTGRRISEFREAKVTDEAELVHFWAEIINPTEKSASSSMGKA